jgi:hypothetical protein
MGMFDKEMPTEVTPAQAVMWGADRVTKGVGSALGYGSKEEEVLKVMQKVDPSNLKSVTAGYRQILKIDPEAGTEYKEQMLPFLKERAKGAGQNTMSTHAKRMDVAARGVGCDLRTDGKDCYAKTQRAAAKLQADEGYKANEKAKVTYAEAAGERLTSTNKSLSNIRQQEAWLNEGVKTGWASDTFLGLNRALGIKVSDEEAFLATTRQGNLEDLTAMSGAVSDKDIEVVEQANTQLGNSVEGNLMILKVKKAALKNVQQQERDTTKWMMENPSATMADVNNYKEEWRQAHPIGLASKDEFSAFRSGKYVPTKVQDSAANKLQDAKDNIQSIKDRANAKGY